MVQGPVPTEEILNKLFDHMWPDLELVLRKDVGDTSVPARTLEDMAEETLTLVRQIAKNQQRDELQDRFLSAPVDARITELLRQLWSDDLTHKRLLGQRSKQAAEDWLRKAAEALQSPGFSKED
jgi:hypothetical protein